jgi:catechol 2,3-dioxygenase-like lactoylglutathione lyase family enzyme
MILYITLGTNDLARATRFYDPVMAALGLSRLRTLEDEIGYAAPGDDALPSLGDAALRRKTGHRGQWVDARARGTNAGSGGCLPPRGAGPWRHG